MSTIWYELENLSIIDQIGSLKLAIVLNG